MYLQKAATPVNINNIGARIEPDTIKIAGCPRCSAHRKG
jgi:hypothetical protein